MNRGKFKVHFSKFFTYILINTLSFVKNIEKAYLFPYFYAAKRNNGYYSITRQTI